MLEDSCASTVPPQSWLMLPAAQEGMMQIAIHAASPKSPCNARWCRTHKVKAGRRLRSECPALHRERQTLHAAGTSRKLCLPQFGGSAHDLCLSTLLRLWQTACNHRKCTSPQHFEKLCEKFRLSAGQLRALAKVPHADVAPCRMLCRTSS